MKRATMPWWLALLVSGVLLLVLKNSSFAQLVTVHFTARVIGFYDPNNKLEDKIQVSIGDKITGYYMYDLSTPDSDSDSMGGRYEHYHYVHGMIHQADFEFAVNGFTFKKSQDFGEFTIYIDNGTISGTFLNITDSYHLQSKHYLLMPRGFHVEDVNLYLKDPSGQALASDVLPSAPPNLQDWEIRELHISGIVYTIIAEVESINAEPIPTAELTLDIVDAMDCRDGAEVTNDPERLAICGREVAAIAADGVAKLLLRVDADSAGEVTFSRSPAGLPQHEGVLRSLDGMQEGESITVNTVSTSSGEKAYAIYEAPLDFVRSAEDASRTSREVTLQAEFAGVAADTRTISVLRPLVILVHGLWATPDTWKNFTPLINDARFVVSTPDYGYGLVRVVTTDPVFRETKPPGEPIRFVNKHALGLHYNAEKHVFPQSIKSLEDFRNSSNPLSAPAAAVQADFVAHSMGGLVTRMLPLLPDFLSDNTFGRGIIHKLITIGTPHLGTPLASQLLRDENQCVRDLFGEMRLRSFRSVVLAPTRERVNGAVFDLQGDGKAGGFVSDAIADLQNSPIHIPTIMIGGKMTTAQLNGLDCEFGLFSPRECIPAIIKRVCGEGPFSEGSPLITHFTSEGWPVVLGGDSDGIVPLTSQLNGLSPIGLDSYIFPAVHSHGANDLGFIGDHLQEEASGIPQTVIDLLNEPVFDYIPLPE